MYLCLLCWVLGYHEGWSVSSELKIVSTMLKYIDVFGTVLTGGSGVVGYLVTWQLHERRMVTLQTELV